MATAWVHHAVNHVTRTFDEVIPLTVPEVRRLLWGVVWRTFPSIEQVLAWSVWRRHHQAVAKRCHYRRRGVILP